MPSLSPQSEPLLETVRRVAETVVPPTDEQLWERIRADLCDLVALTELYRRWRSPLVLLAYQRRVASDHAEEIVNDAFVRLLRRRDRIAAITHAFAYMRRCVDRACWRASRIERRRAAREMLAGVAAAAGVTDPDAVGRAELADAVNAALGRLSDRQRLAAELHYLFGWTEAQVAQAIGVKSSTVKEHLDRAREKLREALAKWNPSAAAVGGLAVGSVLADAAQSGALPPERLSAVVQSILAQATAPAAWGKPLVVLAAVLALCGVAVAGQAFLGGTETPPAPAAKYVAAPPESLQTKNLRLFDAEVKPKLVASLQSLALGNGGTVESLEARAFDTRIECDAVVRHGPPIAFQTKLNIVFDTLSREPRLRLDFTGNGQWRGLNPEQPIYWENPFTGQRIVRRVPALDEAVAAFKTVEWADPRATGEAAACVEALRRAAPSYEGIWYECGDARKPVIARFDPNDHLPFLFTFVRGNTSAVGLIDLKVDPDGRLGGVSFLHMEGVLSPDGSRVDFPGSGAWWSRKPVAEGK
jgi:RNA polymerase sigma factor (sigma-70 family)